MLARVMEGMVETARQADLVEAVHRELAPGFLRHAGARCGYWLADPTSGHTVEITLWSDAGALQAASKADAAARSAIAGSLRLRVLSVHTTSVLACRGLGQPEPGQTAADRLRLTWVEGVSGSNRNQLPALYDEVVADQLTSGGFCGSFWLGEESSGEGCAVSLWRGASDPDGAAASARRRRRVARRLGCRVGEPREYRLVASAGLAGDVLPSLVSS